MNELLPLIIKIQEHINVINGEMGEMNISIAVLQSQVADLIWYFRAVAGGILALLVSQFWQVVILRKNNKKTNAK